jgi:hypothetical protein
MPDLDHAALADWTAQYGGILLDIPDDPQRLAIEADHDCEAAVCKIGQYLDQALDTDPQRLSATLRDAETRSILGRLLTRMSLTRQTRLIDWLFTAGVPNGQNLVRQLAAPGGDGTGEAIRESMIAVHRQKMLARIFGKERMGALLDAVRITEADLQHETREQ